MRVCRRNCCVSLIFLSSLAIIYTTRRTAVGNNWQVVITDTMAGAHSNVQQISQQEISLATPTQPWNAISREVTDLRQSLNLRESDTSPQNDITHPPLSLARGAEEGGEGGRRVPPAVWRERQVVPPVVWRERQVVPPAVWRARQVGHRDQETRRLQQLFPLSKHFSFPNPQITLPMLEIDDSLWMKNLRRHLSNLTEHKVINLVTSNSLYQDVLLNWLISAVVRSGLDLTSVLVISLDAPLHARLYSRGIPSVNVPLFKLIRRDTTFTKAFDKVMMIRLAVMRLISHWGFDIHNYDTDAVLLRNPQPLYDQLIDSDIIGSVGRIPNNLMTKWGITICIGVVIFRSSTLIEQYWQAMSRACTSSLDDQEKLNCGLEALGMSWDNAESDQNITIVRGQCENDLRVSILPFSDICRLATCDPSRRNYYYIWHKGGNRTRREKLMGSRDGRTWFLRYKWNNIDNHLQGRDWLESIAYWQITHS